MPIRPTTSAQPDAPYRPYGAENIEERLHGLRRKPFRPSRQDYDRRTSLLTFGAKKGRRLRLSQEINRTYQNRCIVRLTCEIYRPFNAVLAVQKVQCSPHHIWRKTSIRGFCVIDGGPSTWLHFSRYSFHIAPRIPLYYKATNQGHKGGHVTCQRMVVSDHRLLPCELSYVGGHNKGKQGEWSYPMRRVAPRGLAVLRSISLMD